MKTAYCFNYHDVTDDPKTSGFQNPDAYIYTHSVNHFSSDLDLILNSLPRKVIRLSSLPQDGGLPEADPGLLLTFDDGGVSGIHIAAELEKRSLRGYFFMTTGMLGDPHFLSAEQLRQLDQRGHIIGTHSHHHYSLFKALSYPDKLVEWKKSRKILEDILDHRVTTGSIPGGKMNTDTFRAAEEAGLKLLFTTEPTRKVRMYGSLAIVGRICPKESTSKSFLKWSASAKTIFPITVMWQAKQIIKSFPKLNRKEEHKMELHESRGNKSLRIQKII